MCLCAGRQTQIGRRLAAQRGEEEVPEEKEEQINTQSRRSRKERRTNSTKEKELPAEKTKECPLLADVQMRAVVEKRGEERNCINRVDLCRR